MFKKIAFPLFSLFLMFRSYKLLLHLTHSSPTDFSTIQSLFIAFLLTLFITGIFAFVGFAYPSNKLLPQSYYKVHKPKTLKNWSRKMGVKYFQRALLLAFWGRKKQRLKYFDGSKNGLENFSFQTKQSEFGHLVALVIICMISMPLLLHGYYTLVGFITAINIIGNLYPILLQRQHRARLQCMKERLNGRTS